MVCATFLPFHGRSVNIDGNWDYHANATLALQMGFQTTHSLDPAFDFLSGHQFSTMVTNRLRYKRWRARVSIRAGREAIGTADITEIPLFDDQDRTVDYVASFANNALGARAMASYRFSRWRLGGRAAIDRLWYPGTQDFDVYLPGSATRQLESRQTLIRRDWRLTYGAEASVDLNDYLEVTLGYTFTQNKSNLFIENVDNRSFVKHVGTLTLTAFY